MKIVVIGLGSMGRRRIRLIKKLYPSYAIIGIDCDIERRNLVSDEYGILCYQNTKELIDEGDIQCAFVCTSPISHADIIEECLEKEWNVFTEINLIKDKYEQNIQLAKNKNRLLFLSSTPIYRAEMQNIDSLLAENKEPFHYIYHVGQYLPDWHPWENFQKFFVSDSRTSGCREIFAIELPWMTKIFGPIEKVQVSRNKLTQLPIDYNDSYFVHIFHENGNCGIFAVDVVCRQAIRHLEIYNEQIYIEWNGTPDTLRYKDISSGCMRQVDADVNYEREEGYSEFVNEYAYAREIREFFKLLEAGGNTQYGFEEDIKILAIIDEIEGN